MMSRRQFYVALAVLGVSGLVGGLLGAWLLPAGAVWAQGEGVAKEVRAEQFVLVDAAGDVRAKLSVFGGHPNLRLFDEAGEARAELGLSFFNDYPALRLFDEAGETRADLGLYLGLGEPGLRLYDAAGDMRTELALSGGEPHVWLDDAAGQTRVVLGRTKTEDRRTGVTTTHPTSTITLFGETRLVQWQAP